MCRVLTDKKNNTLGARKLVNQGDVRSLIGIMGGGGGGVQNSGIEGSEMW